MSNGRLNIPVITPEQRAELESTRNKVELVLIALPALKQAGIDVTETERRMTALKAALDKLKDV